VAQCEVLPVQANARAPLARRLRRSTALAPLLIPFAHQLHDARGNVDALGAASETGVHVGTPFVGIYRHG